MNYARNYLNVSSLAEKIRQSASVGKVEKAAGGLAARERRREMATEEPDFEVIRAQYMNMVQDMFSEAAPQKEASSEENLSYGLASPLLGAGEEGLTMGYEGGTFTLGVDQAEAAERIESKLIEKGVPENLAKGFVMTFVDESGLNPVINEANPIVPGSRGGFGLYQLTGPRRVAFENYTAERGIDISDPAQQEDAQLDFMLMELEGPESKAWEVIQTADSPGMAAALITKHFLRPAKQHQDARISKYLGRSTDYVTKPKTRP